MKRFSIPRRWRFNLRIRHKIPPIFSRLSRADSWSEPPGAHCGGGPLLPVVTAAFLVLGTVAAFAVSGDGSARAGDKRTETNFLHRTWQFEDGLPHNTVQALLQTRDGYLWVGTPNGLARFDGAEFTLFNPDNTPALKSPQIRRLCETRDGSLWIATDQGLSRMKDGSFMRYSTTDGLAGDVVRALQEMEDGSLWIGTITGISIFADGEFHPPEHEALNGVIRDIRNDRDGNIWIADARNLLRLSGNDLTSFGREDAARRAPANIFRAIGLASDGSVWAGGMHGISRFHQGGFSQYDRHHGLADNVVNVIREDSRGNLWIGTFGGLNRFSGGRLVPELDAQGHAYDVVYAIEEDRDGNLWIGSKDGLSQLRPRVFTTLTTRNGLGNNNIMSVLEDRSGKLWVGSWGGGLDVLEQGQITFSLNRESTLSTQPDAFMFSDFVLAVHETRRRGIWFGLDYDGGLYRYHDSALRRFGEEDGLSPSAVRVIYEDRRENLWVGNRNALHLFKDGAFLSFTTANGLPENLVRVIGEDSDGNLWFGTEKGLVRFVDGRFIEVRNPEGPEANLIMALYPDDDDNLWVGTAGGLVRYRDGIFTTYTTSHGLFNNEVMEIVEDDFGYLWMSCRFGIFRVLKSDLDALDRGEISSFASSFYGKHDGILSIQANASTKPSGTKTRDGRVWFATSKGLVVVDPRAVLPSDGSPPPIRITRIVLGQENLEPAALSPSIRRDRQMEVHFAALSFTLPEKNRFRYKLEGFDDEWVEAGSRRVAYYANLRPGHYTFRVIGSNNEGLWNEEGDSIAFYVAPRFWETGWFVVGCLLAGGSSVIGLHQLRLRRLQRREAQLEHLVDDRTRTLQAEIAERKRFEIQLENTHRRLLEASHKAGMAEVASGVLHNVGNVLNSVNVSASLITDSVRRARLNNLKKAVALLNEHRDRLGEFLTADQRGRQLPAYLDHLADFLSKEQEAVLGELGGLCRNVDHIKEIVAMQQNYARLSGVIETLPAIDLMEDALRMNLAALCRHGIEVVRRYSAAPVVSVDKHRVLQILVNLIRNAKYACTESGRADKTISVSVTAPSSGEVQIIVSDNGVGIDREDLHRIFSHGFTTRSEGHGFGLHSAALAAREINGSLTARSDGPGRGATFILDIPLQPEIRRNDDPTEQPTHSRS